MIDFDGLVLAQCMNAFAPPITVTPIASQPLAAPYAARGIWEIQLISIPTEDGGVYSNRTIKLGIRMSEFPVCPQQGDWITTLAQYLPLAYRLDEQITPTANVDFMVDDQSPDGQGGAMLTLKRQSL